MTARWILGLTLLLAASPAWGATLAETRIALPSTTEEALAASIQQALGARASDASAGAELTVDDVELPVAGTELAAAGLGFAAAPGEEDLIFAQAGSAASDSAAAALMAVAKTPVGIAPYVVKRRPGLAAAEIVFINGLVWTYDRFIRSGGGAGFRVGFQSWKQNILNGFNWDDNGFSTNQYAHPYHGSINFNAARSNGYGYFESFAFSWGGSYLWEYFGETHHPALNDWINTSMGGAAFGEALFRLSRMITDNTATGSGRFWKEVGGTVVNPARGLTRMVTGEWSEVRQNAPDRFAKSHHMVWRFGARTEGSGNLWTSDTTHAFLELAAGYGDVFLGEYKKPFDTFDFGLQVNFKDKETIGRVQAKGLLFATPYSESENTKTLIGGYQYYDYINNSAFEFGAQRIGASFMSQRKSGKDFEARTHIDLLAIVLGATGDAYPSFTGRDYDFGPGAAVIVGGELRYKGHPFFSLEQQVNFIHTLNGTPSDHLLNETTVAIEIPLFSTFALNATYFLYQAKGYYDEFTDVYQRTPFLRTSLSWHRR